MYNVYIYIYIVGLIVLPVAYWLPTGWFALAACATS